MSLNFSEFSYHFENTIFEQRFAFTDHKTVGSFTKKLVEFDPESCSKKKNL